uniref:ATPase P n=1 Tax=Thermodesulfobacterium geofontis TaxID=1295609 RepID=A0A7V6CDT1_9BACT
MFELEIPGFGLVKLEHLVADFTGTLSFDGKLIPGVKERLNKISEFLKIHVLTADTFGKAKEELSEVNCEVHILKGKDQDLQKEKFVKALGAEQVIAFGNGNNDRSMLKVARIGVAVLLEEGCSVEALSSANILVKSILDGLDLLLNPLRLKATLRF